jgi:hypothetical protein
LEPLIAFPAIGQTQEAQAQQEAIWSVLEGGEQLLPPEALGLSKHVPRQTCLAPSSFHSVCFGHRLASRRLLRLFKHGLVAFSHAKRVILQKLWVIQPPCHQPCFAASTYRMNRQMVTVGSFPPPGRRASFPRPRKRCSAPAPASWTRNRQSSSPPPCLPL